VNGLKVARCRFFVTHAHQNFQTPTWNQQIYMMTSTQIRQSFLDFFKSKQHTIVPSSSLMPDSPNLLFTNAGMNQFVPIFLGQAQCPYTPGRAADTQKCIRAGGKHNDLDDVGLDTYHHTFFEMLGNWSFGDYFKKEAIGWAWELVVEKWKFTPTRLYATVFCPYLGEPGWEKKWAIELEQVIALAMTSPNYIPPNSNTSPFEMADQEAAMYWAKKFSAVGCDPKVHIVPGNKKDNFWMMGETGPCGPCTEIHVDLTPAGNTHGSLVNKGDARCIEIWNNVFIQFNAQPKSGGDASSPKGGSGAPAAGPASPATGASQPLIEFVPLAAQHVDTGMGFERVTSIIQGTNGLTDFHNAKISNYETDIFRPIFDVLEAMSGKKYTSTLPPADLSTINSQQSTDIAFRVIGDHIRTLSFAIADGIQPGNNDRNYVLRRILRRAVRYGRTLGFREPFFYKLVDILAETMGDVFPEIRARKQHVQDTIRVEEEAFNKTLDKGIDLFEAFIFQKSSYNPNFAKAANFGDLNRPKLLSMDAFEESRSLTTLASLTDSSNFDLPGVFVFKLYDTYGFPLDLTELMARERGLTVDKVGFNELMEKQKNQSRINQKKVVIELSQIETTTPTKFVGYDNLAVEAKVLEVVSLKDKTAVILDVSSCYAEMGGQVGDTGELSGEGQRWRIANTQKSGNTFLHFVESGGDAPVAGSQIKLTVEKSRRDAIQRHHTVTHLLHWALHEVASKEASQKGSFVGPDKLTFDFNSAPLTPAQVADIEKLVNERILENADVSWTEVPHADVKHRKDVMQFFGDKYGDTVRVVQIGGSAGLLNGYSMELCGGTHTRATGEIGLFRIVSEAAVAAGVRRIEAVAGLTAYDLANHQLQLIRSIAGKINSPVGELEKKIEAMLAHQKALEKEIQIALQRNASNAASELLGTVQVVNDIPLITHNLGDANGDFLQAIADSLKGRFKGVVVLGGGSDSSVTLIATVSADFTSKVQAGKIIQAIAPIVGGKGGGKPDNARGGGKDASKLDEALAKAKTLL
jgi:alanyl-tRNA synthetase